MNNIGLLILRVGFSSFLITHGYPKFMKMLNGDFGFADPIGIGQVPSLVLSTIAELICPVLIIIGFKTKWMSLPVIINMSVAGFIVHASDSFDTKEKALLFLIGFVAIAILGGGKYGVDRD